MNEERAGRGEPPAGKAPSFLEPRHSVDSITTVRVDRRVHGTNNEIGGTAAYKYGMDVIFTVTCQVCRMDVDENGSCESWYPEQRIHYSRADLDQWWRAVLETVRRHQQTNTHAVAVATRDALGS